MNVCLCSSVLKTYLQPKNNIHGIHKLKSFIDKQNIYKTWPSAGSPAFNGLKAECQRCGFLSSLYGRNYSCIG